MNTFKTIQKICILSAVLFLAACQSKPVEKTKYTVNFHTDGGTVIADQIIEEGCLVSKPEDPIKEGYFFENWYKEGTFVNVYDFNTPVHSNFSLYAKYEPALQTFTVSFDSNGGSAVSSQEVLEGNKIKTPNVPTKADSVFEGWYLNDEEYDFDLAVTSDLTLKAFWRDNLNYIVSTIPATGNAYDVRNDKVKDYVDNFEKEYSAKYKSHGDQYKNKPLVLSWNTTKPFDSFIVDVSDDKSFATYKSYSCFENRIAIENVKTDHTYYWQVSCVENGIISSSGEIYEVYVEKAPRLVNVDCVTNTRDIGGMYAGNKRIKQGMAYRSARLDDVSAKGKNTLVNDFGIKTEIELREEKEISPIGVNLISAAFPWWTGKTEKGIDNPAYWPAVKTIVEAFTKEENYPLDFHCSIGQDRTGTLAILIEGLCGVSLRDIYIDYELTSFSSVTDGDDPINQSIHNKYYYQVEPLIAYLQTFGSANDTFQQCVINFLTGTIGVSLQDIEAIQNILLEDR